MPMPPSARLLLVIARACGAGPAAADPTVRDLVERSESQVRVDPEESRQLAEQALQGLASAPDADLGVWAHLLLCEHHAERSRGDAERHLAAARALLPQVQRAGLRARLLACEGDLQENGGDSAGAMTLYEQAVVTAEAAKDDEYLAEALYRRGHLRSLRAEFASGLSDLKRAHALFRQLGKEGHATTVQNAIAILYNRLGDHAQARQYFEAALKAQAAAGLTREQLVTQHNLGRVLENLGDWGAAEHAFAQCMALAQSLAYRRGEVYALRGLASVHNARGRPTEALALLDRAAAMQREVPDARLRAQIQLQRGIALSQLRRAGEALAALNEALAVLKAADSPAERVRTHEALARLMVEQADWRASFEQQRAARELTEELLRRQVDERFATLKVEYDGNAREQAMHLLQREQAATAYALEQERLAGRLRSATVALGAVLLTLLALLAWRQRHGKLAMRRLALTDELTELPNRRDVLSRLDQRLRRGGACALLIVDLDHFKRINDGHGHPAGDEVLRGAAAVLRETAPADAFFGRLGGEEFVVVLPDAPMMGAEAHAEVLRPAIEAIDLSHIGLPGPGTSSVGVTVSAIGDNAIAMLRRADRALYAAKAGGRNRVESEPPAVPAATRAAAEV